jgi:hypothetical protein
MKDATEGERARNSPFARSSTSLSLLLGVIAVTPLRAQHDHGHHGDSATMVGAADAAMSGPLSADARKHLVMSPTRPATREDSARAREIAETLRTALARYADTAAAVADGYRMFAPGLKRQRVYHFTHYGNAFKEAFRFDPAKPTSILYRRGTDGTLELLGAMYTMPKRTELEKLDERVPLSIGSWHKHVNWCVPRPRQGQQRWLERKNGKPVFGPESPIATREQCDGVNGLFLASPMGWMIHLNVFAGTDLGSVFSHEH